MKTDYEKLREEFDYKVKDLQSSCLHEQKEWVMKGELIRPLNLKYKVLICNNCKKELRKKKNTITATLGKMYFGDEIILTNNQRSKRLRSAIILTFFASIIAVLLILRILGVIG
ncbi:MAG: hypothetical protein ABIC91_04560 [Nanoarchaeota archaeon]|nr:hypothetical protein [Nanoarchaeota archaeon]MBU1030247.1 hypothetical protein [Nanoarchaeota archaeon]MBU1850668.1 hypothetical protein [Nanoarchaeota archaeon]